MRGAWLAGSTCTRLHADNDPAWRAAWLMSKPQNYLALPLCLPLCLPVRLLLRLT